MSNIGDYFRSKELDKKELLKQETIYRLIAFKNLDRSLDDSLPKFDFSIIKKEELEFTIQSFLGWEKTSTGFEYRNNFHLSDNGDDILFDRYFITRSNDHFKSDGSEVADDFIRDQSKILELLLSIYQVYDMLTQRYDTDVKKELAEFERRWQFFNGESREKAYLNTSHTRKYFFLYGELGKKLLMKWLNKLSDTSNSVEELVEEFSNDVNDAKAQFGRYVDDKCFSFEEVLLVELMQYSPRGKILRGMYHKSKEKKSGSDQK